MAVSSELCVPSVSIQIGACSRQDDRACLDIHATGYSAVSWRAHQPLSGGISFCFYVIRQWEGSCRCAVGGEFSERDGNQNEIPMCLPIGHGQIIMNVESLFKTGKRVLCLSHVLRRIVLMVCLMIPFVECSTIPPGGNRLTVYRRLGVGCTRASYRSDADAAANLLIHML